MYNRYVPQSDGSFHRSRIPEPESVLTLQDSVQATQEPEHVQTSRHSGPRKMHKLSNPMQTHSTPMNYRSYSVPEQVPSSVSSFLRGLLPQNFDTEDLIVVLLLLLISGNSAKDQNAALMTLGIYLFL